MTLNIKKHWKIIFVFQAVHIYLIYSKHWVCIILNSLFSIYVLYIKIIVRQHLTLVNKVVTQTTTIFTFAWETSFLSFLLIRLTLFCSKYWQEMCFTAKHFFSLFFNIFSYYIPALSFTHKRLGGFFFIYFFWSGESFFPWVANIQDHLLDDMTSFHTGGPWVEESEKRKQDLGGNTIPVGINWKHRPPAVCGIHTCKHNSEILDF